jgi:hypothetical protein
VFRSWSRPQIANDLPGESGFGAGGPVNGKVLKTMQVCTCAKFRKRIEPSNAKFHGINIGSLDDNTPIFKTSDGSASVA